MNRKQTGKKTFIGLICLVSLIFAGCNNLGSIFGDEGRDDPEIVSIDTNVVTANTQFGFDLFNDIRKTEQDKNIFISPLSISIALAMTLNGASGETEQAMTNTLQLKGLDAASINTGYAGLRHALQTSDPKVTLTIANSLWARQDVPFTQDFLQRNTEFFGAEVSTLNFMDPNTLITINQWVNTNTNGKIQKILDEINPDMVLFLINAIYFKGTWQTEFDPSRTRDGTFYLATGAEKQVPMMTRTGDYPYYENHEEKFQAISLPYGDGRMSMYIFLPYRESDLNTFLDGFTTENWENWISQFREREVFLSMPKFKLEYEKTLNNPLQSLGMGIAFAPGLADFSRMADLEVLGQNLYIGEVLHKAVVEVNEEGTEAAAVTSVGIRATSAPPAFMANRPFFFAIRDNETKTVLFMGTVVDP
ncbi:proteinase inhibitor I4 serpin [Candidatus Poribacteria bacterium]|nr:MAG: proteinase inhibitor I4 serpin [Candidatus Poribacteria bacterium]